MKMERHSPLVCDCGGQLSDVLDSRPNSLTDGTPVIKRRRKCGKCDARSTTFEILERDVERFRVELRKELIIRLMADV